MPTRSQWKVLETRTKVPVTGQAHRTSITSIRELGSALRTHQWAQIQQSSSARGVSRGLAHACSSDKIPVRRRACP